MQEHKRNVTQRLRALAESPPHADAAFKQRLTRALQQQLQSEPHPLLFNIRGRLQWHWLATGLAVLLLASGLVVNVFTARAMLTVRQGIAEVHSSPGTLLPWSKPRSGLVKSNGGVSIEEGTTIILPDDGAGELALFHGSRVELAPGTQVTLTAAQPGSFIRDSVVRMDVSSGEVRAEVTPLRSPTERFEVATPSVLVSVKGTVFCTRVITAGHSYIATDAGIVVVTLDDPEQGYPSVEVPAGYAVNAIVGMPLVVYPQHPDSLSQGSLMSSLATGNPFDLTATPSGIDASSGIEGLSSLLNPTEANQPSLTNTENLKLLTPGIVIPTSPTVSLTLPLTPTLPLSDSHPYSSNALTPTPTPVPLAPITGADLGITQWLNPDPTAAEGRLTYIVGVTNYGPAIAQDIVITDILPPEVRLITATLPLKQNDTALIWTLATLGVGDTQKLVVEVGVRTWVTRTFTNVVSVTGSLPDPVLSNNFQAIRPRLTRVANVAITEVVLPSQVGAGGVLTGVIRYANLGPATARGVTITLQLPSVLHFGGSIFDPPVSFIPQQHTPGTLWLAPSNLPTWTIDRLPSGQSGALVFTATVQSDTLGAVISTASITATTPDNNARNDIYQKLISIMPMADLRVSQQSYPEAVIAGDVLTYTLSYTNQGVWPAQNLWISATLSPDVTFGSQVSAPPELSAPNHTGRLVTWYTPVLAPGATGQVVFTVTTQRRTQNPLYYRVRIGSTTLDEPAYNVSDGYTPVLIPAFQVRTMLTPTRIAPLMPLAYAIQITNTGQITFAAGSLQLAISLPPDMAYVAGTEALQAIASGDLIGRNPVPLAPGETITLNAVISPTSPLNPGGFLVTTSVTTTTPGGALATMNSALWQVVYPTVTLGRQVIHGEKTLPAETRITMTVYLTNTGPSVLSVLPLQDQFDPDALYLVSAYPLPTITTPGRLTWTNLTAPAPYGVGHTLMPRDSVSVTMVFTTPYPAEASPVPLKHRLSVNGVTDIYQNHAPDATYSWIVAGKVRIYLALLLRQ
ncbi:MAG: DUF11 domain-containing protein [Anaerolineae bacterium]|nr:DUF11 domain-containing protein [Anaerolineae bacterium]